MPVSKKISVICVHFCVVLAVTATAAVAQPQSGGKYSVQVPHVVLPETIQYKSFAENATASAVDRPATYTAFPSYNLPADTEFRTINQLYYPVTPQYPAGAFAETVAQINADNHIIPMPPSPPQPEAEPVYLTKLNESPIRQVSDSSAIESADENETPVGSIAFLKSQRVDNSGSYLAGTTPLRLSPETDLRSSWLERESRFVRPVTYSDVAPPTQLGFMPPSLGYQQAQVLPAYGQQPYGTAAMPNPNYAAATGLNSAWNAYPGAAAAQQVSPQVQQYQSLRQLGSIMPAMTGQPTPPAMQMPGYGMAMPQAMPPQMPQQTIGYILLYPQAAQSGVTMQLAGQPGGDTNGESSTDANTPTDPNTLTWNGMQLQATFIPAAQMPQMQIPNPMTPGGMNPYMMSGMNPYMMNPYMMSGMNPYMMNPYMMGGMNPYMMPGMGGMMPSIIIQMPADSGPRRTGLIARLRAARQESQNRSQQANSSLATLFFAQPEQMPAKAAYPYGYFGVTASPYQAGNFGGYHNMSTQTVRYPGM